MMINRGIQIVLGVVVLLSIAWIGNWQQFQTQQNQVTKTNIQITSSMEETSSIEKPTQSMVERITPAEIRPIVDGITVIWTTLQAWQDRPLSINKTNTAITKPYYLGEADFESTVIYEEEVAISHATTALEAVFVEPASEPAISPDSSIVTVAYDRLPTANQVVETAMITTTPALTVSQAWSNRINIMLIGADERPGGKAGRADTTIVVTINPVSKTVGMLSFPRDLWVTIPGYEGKRRLNAAHRLGDYRSPGGGGVDLLKQTLAENFGLEIDYYAKINFTGFEELVDIIGGLDIYAPETIDSATYYGFVPLYINPEKHYSFIPANVVNGAGKPIVNIHEVITQTYYVTDTAQLGALAQQPGYRMLYVPAGGHHIDGETALQYARSRATISADFDRMARQQVMLMALRQQALQSHQLINIPQLWQSLQHTIKTDLTMMDILKLARLAQEIGGNNIQAVTIDYTMTEDYKTDKGARVLLPLYDKINPLLQEMFGVTQPEAMTNTLTLLD